MTGPDPAHCAAPPSWEQAFASARDYLLYLAERQLGPELHAKGGASDLVQTALLHAHQASGRFRGQTAADRRGWLRRILLNVIHKFRRRWRAAPRNSARETPLAGLSDQTLPPAHQDSPSHVARQQEQREQMARAVARLTEEQQRVLGLRIDDNLPFDEVGRRIGKSGDAARMIYNRSLQRLQALLHRMAIEGP